MNPTLVFFWLHGLAMFYLYPNGTGPSDRRLSTSSWQQSFPVVRHVQSPRMMMTTVMRRIPKPKKILQLSESGLTLKRGVNHSGMTTQAPLPLPHRPASQGTSRRIQRLQCLHSRRVQASRHRMSVPSVGKILPSAPCLVKRVPWYILYNIVTVLL